MPRPQRCRRICSEPEYSCFEPEGVINPETVVLSVDEYEVLRLVDYEKQNHEDCAIVMDISRTTVTEIYERARYKISDCIVNGKQLVISGGNYRICSKIHKSCCKKVCRRYKENNVVVKGRKDMKIAVTYDNGEIFQHFGHTKYFKVYEVKNALIVNSEVIDSNGSGHGALAGLLKEKGIEILICGGIGSGAQMALNDVGIELYGGVTGNADEAVLDLISGNLKYNSDVKCSHHSHEEGHNCGSHGCGNDGCH
ncbi:MAG: DUF134 domain-containing protein [Anaeroplasmataceae bacterium]